MKTKKLLFSLCLAMLAPHAFATGEAEQASKDNAGIAEISASETPKKKSRFTIGGYGEAVYSRNFYSDSYLRYSSPNRYKDETHGQNEEGGEYEAEIERGGEVALEQFWLQKSFCPEFNIKLGHIIVPVGATNAHHLPTEFFGVYRPEGENTIMPCTWHQTGISLWGQAGDWRYEALLVAGLNSELFGRQSWIHDGAASPYEFKIANSMAGAFRVDNYSIKGLRLSLSGYVGNSFRNTLKVPVSDSYDGVNGTVLIGAFDFLFDRWNWIARGNFDYGYLSDSDIISAYNKDYSDTAPTPMQSVASEAIAAGVEVGYNLFSQIDKLDQQNQKLYLFGRYDYYDSMFNTVGSIVDFEYCGRHRVSVGLNYYPIKDIVLKGEYSIGLLKSQYNNEPAISLGVAYSGLFNM